MSKILLFGFQVDEYYIYKEMYASDFTEMDMYEDSFAKDSVASLTTYYSTEDICDRLQFIVASCLQKATYCRQFLSNGVEIFYFEPDDIFPNPPSMKPIPQDHRVPSKLIQESKRKWCDPQREYDGDYHHFEDIWCGSRKNIIQGRKRNAATDMYYMTNTRDPWSSILPKEVQEEVQWSVKTQLVQITSGVSLSLSHR